MQTFTLNDILTIYSSTVSGYLNAGYNINPTSTNFLGGDAYKNARIDLRKGNQFVRVLLIADEEYLAGDCKLYPDLSSIPSECYSHDVLDISTMSVQILDLPCQRFQPKRSLDDKDFDFSREYKFYQLPYGKQNSNCEDTRYMQLDSNDPEAVSNYAHIVKHVRQLKKQRADNREFSLSQRYFKTKVEVVTEKTHDICARFMDKNFGPGCKIDHVNRCYSPIYGTCFWEIYYTIRHGRKIYTAHIALSDKNPYNKPQDLHR